ncbi:hypothetical protein HZS_7308, partial [Henneguya salminicola]
ETITKEEELINDYNACNKFDATVDVKNITVTRDGQRNIFENFSVQLLSDKIYILLGENGSGKSTLIETILGIIKPTRGNISLKNHHTETQKNIIGYCPQHDLIIDYLTVIEHIYFYWRIKTNTDPNINMNEIEEMINIMELGQLKNTYARNLSGGQKRKLSIGIAFIADPFLVILDEPTSGVDPESRRSVYDYIFACSKRKTILITTHHMEETEILGDEIMVMSAGKLIEKGSLLNLKNKFGSPSKLAIETTDPNKDGKKISKFVYDNCNHVINHIIRNNEVIFDISNSYKQDDSLENLISALKKEKNILNINLWTFNDCSMEETDSKSKIEHKSDSKIAPLIEELKTPTQKPSFLKQLYLKSFNRMRNSLRSNKFYFIQLFIPFCTLLIACLLQYFVLYNKNDNVVIHLSHVVEFWDIFLPIQHETVKEYEEINPILLEILNLNKDKNQTDIYKKTIVKNLFGEHSVCPPKEANNCKFNKNSIEDTLKYFK